MQRVLFAKHQCQEASLQFTALADQIMDHMAMHVSQTEVSSLITIRQSFVVDAEQVQNGRVEIVNVHRAGCPLFFARLRSQRVAVFVGDIVTVRVGLSVRDTGFNTAASHPCGEAARVMIAAVVLLREISLTIHGAAKLSAPDDQCVIQHASLLQVSDQSGAALVDVFAL